MREYFLLCVNNSTTNKTSKTLLTVVHIVIHNGSNNGAWNIAFKASKPLWKMWKYKINIFYTLKKTERPTVIDNLVLLKRYTTFNELVIKNTLVKNFRFDGRVSPALKTNLITEVATGGVLKEKVFLAISQFSLENNCARVFFLMKLQASASEKRDFGTGAFLWILWSF